MSPIIANAKPISPLRRRMIEDMTVRGFGEKTQSDYIRHVKNFTIFLGRSPDTATPEDVRAYQLSQREAGVQGAFARLVVGPDEHPVTAAQRRPGRELPQGGRSIVVR